MLLKELIASMETIAPTRYAEAWDNVGLIAGDPEQKIARAMLTIDYTSAVADEAREARCDAIIAYHPPLFEAIKKLNSDSLIFDAIHRGVAIYSPHTALDVAEGGTNDMLADVLMLLDRKPLRLLETKATQYKLITFLPASAFEKVSTALFAAGAGHIGQYSACSFRSVGTGTYFGEKGSKPTVGSAGKLEQVEEMRLETLIPINRLTDVMDALKKSHPYEEVAFDLLPLLPTPEGKGLGRIGRLPGDVTGDMLINHIKRELELSHLLIAGDPTRMIKRAAVCAGACGDLLNDALTQKADLYLTGEMRHHDAIRAAKAGMVVVCTLHSNSERAALKRLKDQLKKQLPALEVLLSQQDRDPFSVH